MFKIFNKNDNQFREDVRRELSSLSDTLDSFRGLLEGVREQFESSKKDNDRLFRDFTEELDDLRDDQKKQFDELKKSLNARQNAKPAADNDNQLLRLIRVYRNELLSLEGMLEQDEAWSQQVQLLKQKMRREESAAGMYAFGKEGDAINLDMHEIAQAVACEDPAMDRTVAAVYEEGYILHGRIAQKAVVAAYKYGGSVYGTGNDYRN